MFNKETLEMTQDVNVEKLAIQASDISSLFSQAASS